MKTKTTTPTKTDLLKVIKNHERNDTKRIEVLRRKLHEATEALKRYEEGNPTYQRLHRASNAASHKFWQAQEQERTARRREATRCKDAIHMQGVSPEVVAMVEKFAKSFS